MSESRILVVKIGGSTLGRHDKDLVAALNALGGRAIGLSGVDGAMIRVSPLDPELGYVGKIEQTEGDMLRRLLEEGYLPVVAPLGLLWDEGPRDQIMNHNADTVGGEGAPALGARWV